MGKRPVAIYMLGTEDKQVEGALKFQRVLQQKGKPSLIAEAEALVAKYALMEVDLLRP